jgi:hypothetical protein
VKRERDESFPAANELRENLRRAAQRQITARTARRRRRQRVSVVLVGVVLLAAGGATAAELISVGSPARDRPGMPTGQRPESSQSGELVLRAPDPQAGGSWGARVYTSRAGTECILVGWLRGVTLGRVEGSRFRPYPPEVTGSCGSLPRTQFFFAVTPHAEPQPRTLVYGRAGVDVQTLRVNDGERIRQVRPGPDGAFLLVLEGYVSPPQVQVRPVNGE